VPIWLKNLFGKENIYAALAAAMVGEILGINLVEISNGLKEYKGVDILDKKGTKIAKTTD
jgi:UDP-N-acetylmuramyl pentapeptide synthase